MKIMLIAGARPNFMKIASIVDAISTHNASAHRTVDALLVHTGQHYDEQMSESFFRDLDLPRPDVNLEVGSASHANQTANIMRSFEPVLLTERPDVLMVVGDVNSTVACALVASKISYPVDNAGGRSRPFIAHVEAGLRSFDRSMPEEINRIVTDTLSDFLFTSEEDAEQNLLREGIPKEKIFFVGNTMVDTLLKHKEKAVKSEILCKLSLAESNGNSCAIPPYGVVTLHRPSNVDNRETFHGILDALSTVAQQIPLFFPIHPRTLNRVKEFGFERYFNFLPNVEGQQSALSSLQSAVGSQHSAVIAQHFASRNSQYSRIIALEPLGYLDFLCLMSNSRLMLTDSGGIQEETTVLGVPCVTLRENTERPVTVRHGTNVLAGTSVDSISRHALLQINNIQRSIAPKRWDGRAGERIIEVLVCRIP
jgi:UDP-N-acetylglucosamine 2-epimerase (non-hydrolysing)